MDSKIDASWAPPLKATKETVLQAMRRFGGRMSGFALADTFPGTDWDDLYDMLLALENEGKIRLSVLH
jgi:hypothetical protein